MTLQHGWKSPIGEYAPFATMNVKWNPAGSEI